MFGKVIMFEVSKKGTERVEILGLMGMEDPVPAFSVPVVNVLEESILPEPLVFCMVPNEHFGQANILGE